MSCFPYQWPLRPPYVVVDGPTGPSALPLAGQPWNGVPLCPGHGLPRFPAQLGQCQHAQLNPFAGGSTGVAPPFQEVVPGTHVVLTARWGARAARLVSQVMPPTAILR